MTVADNENDYKEERLHRLYATVGAERGNRGIDIGLLIRRYR